MPDAHPLEDAADVVHAHWLRAIAIGEVSQDMKDWHEKISYATLALHPLATSCAARIERGRVGSRAD